MSRALRLLLRYADASLLVLSTLVPVMLVLALLIAYYGVGFWTTTVGSELFINLWHLLHAAGWAD